MRPLLVAAALALVSPAAFAQQSVSEQCAAEALAAREGLVAGAKPFATLWWSASLSHDCNIVSFHVAWSPYVPARNGQPAAFGKPTHVVRISTQQISGPRKVSFATSPSCRAVRRVMEKLAALESPKVDVPGLKEQGDIAIGMDGTTYHLWADKTIVPGQRVLGHNDMEYAGWSDSLLHTFATETMASLRSCLSSVEPARPTQ